MANFWLNLSQRIRMNYNFGRRNLNSPNHWEELDLENYNPDKPIVLCLGGNGVIDQAKATRFCGTAERFVGLKLGNTDSSYSHIDLIGFYYDKLPAQPTVGQLNDEQRNAIANNIFIKLCTNKSGERLQIEETIKNFSRVNIFTHCWGAREISMIGMLVERKMAKLGFSKEEIESAFNQIFHLSYAPYSDHSCFPFMRINSFIDSEHNELHELYRRTYRTDLDGVALHYDNAGYFRKNPTQFIHVPILSVYSSQLINTKENSDWSKVIDEHGVELLERNFDWTQGHQSTNAKNADLVSKMASVALATMIAVSIQNKISKNFTLKPTIKELHEMLSAFILDYTQEELKSTLPKLSKTREENSFTF